MIVSEAASKVLSTLAFEDEEEYDTALAIFHVGQAVHEINEGNEFPYSNVVTQTAITSPESDSEPQYWTDVPGRVPLTQLLSTSWSQFGYIKKAWLSDGSSQFKFPEKDLRALLDKHGDDEGRPQGFAIEGDYFYFRPIPPAGDSYTVRFLWHQIPTAPEADDEPRILAQVPYGVIYYASMLACIWSQDDQRIKIFGDMAQRSFETYNLRASMAKDSPSEMEEYDGETR